MEHHDGEGEDVGAIFIPEHSSGTLVLLEVLHSKHLHDLVNLLRLTLGGGGGGEEETNTQTYQ